MKGLSTERTCARTRSGWDLGLSQCQNQFEILLNFLHFKLFYIRHRNITDKTCLKNLPSLVDEWNVIQYIVCAGQRLNHAISFYFLLHVSISDIPCTHITTDWLFSNCILGNSGIPRKSIRSFATYRSTEEVCPPQSKGLLLLTGPSLFDI